MKKYVIDTSAFAKLFINEEDSEQAVKFFDSILNLETKIIVPHLFYYEVLNIAVKKGVSFDIVYSTLQDYQNTILEYQHLSEEAVKKAFEISNTGHQKSGFPSFYDASFHALAIENNCDLITADEKYLLKVKNFGHIKLLSEI